ncbi:hypothetical protein [Ornithinibacillus contaminans]|uniref:hypothetical protein n=1 Tax=Ornithinibacillus contaminans TaxID=694055 RepID=UPI00064DA5C4|nr:hypothetical protein [Ornithinibacillus contaminans]
MSQPSIPNITPNITLTRDDVVNLMLASIALEEIGLSHIINAEGEKIQYVLGTLTNNPGQHASLKEILAINESTQSMLETIFKKEIVLESKLKNALKILNS